MNDSVVKTAIAGKKPESLKDLIRVLEDYDTSYTQNDCGYEFGAEFLKHLSFYDYQASTVSVRFSLSNAAEVCERGKLIPIGIRVAGYGFIS
jgi:hypothetical protein